jgi:RNA polymerase sigma-70 factor (ECF subfamily)
VWIYISSLNLEITKDEKMNDGNQIEINNNFYEKYNPQIRAIVGRILAGSGQGQACDIDDCVNDVYLAIMEKLQQYNESRGSFGAFVAVIARSTALHYRRDNRHKIDELIGNDKLNLLHEHLDIENKVEFQVLVDSILDKLNEQENALFVLRFILFYSPEEIAKSLKIKRNTVDVRINRLKK